MTLLARTPPPFPTESLLGYVLRVSEQNGYNSPWQVFRAAGVSQGRMRTTGIDVERLAVVLGRSASELRPLAYSRAVDGPEEFVLLGNKVSSRSLRLTKPKICPRCIVEKGFIEAHFDLTRLTACPEHRCELLSTCPVCGKALTWFRPGLLTCACGHDLGNSALPDVPSAVADLMAAVRAVALGVGSPGVPAGASGVPMAHLQNMSLRGLLTLIGNLGRHMPAIPGDAEQNLVANAAQVLGAWPENFYQLLRTLAAASGEAGRAASGLRKRLATVYEPLFKNRSIPSAELGFLREAFLRFGLEHWGEGVVDAKLLRNQPAPGESNYVSLTQAAALLGLDPRTVASYAQEGMLHMKALPAGKSRCIVVDIRTANVPKRAPGKSFGERAAAAFVGLPVQVLHSLRRSGDYEARHLAHSRKAFHELDLNALLGKCAARAQSAPYLGRQPDDLISLAGAMRCRVRSADGKADIVRAMLRGTLPVAARTDESLGGTLFQREKVEELLRGKRLESYGNNASLTGAAKRLGCDPGVVPALIEHALLEPVVLFGKTRITEASLQAFESTHVSLASLTKALGTSVRGLTNKCRRRGIPIQVFPRANGTSPQPFVRREHVPAEWLGLCLWRQHA